VQGGCYTQVIGTAVISFQFVCVGVRFAPFIVPYAFFLMEWHVVEEKKNCWNLNYPEVQLQALKPEILICLMVPLANSKAH
jgi:hypothetical protein